MADEKKNTNNPTIGTSVQADGAVIVDPKAGATAKPKTEQALNMVKEVAMKIAESQNVLIALSSDPNVDELATAIGLSIYLDKCGKRATAIYSGRTPNALEFLKPEQNFETSADALQDFVIALNKDKADHLRYKLDGDYVKIFITPYKTKIEESDLKYSYGDFNVDLVIALDVSTGVDLDNALREYGRIMHDAVIIDITTGKPGKFGEMEWSDTRASSVAEMVANLVFKFDHQVEKEEATALLTGIVAATGRFSNAKTTSETMQTVSRLMAAGADQQLVAKNIPVGMDNEMTVPIGGNDNLAETAAAMTADQTMLETPETVRSEAEGATKNVATTGDEATTPETMQPVDPTKFAIAHGKEENIGGDEMNANSNEVAAETPVASTNITQDQAPVAAQVGATSSEPAGNENDELLRDLAAAEAGLRADPEGAVAVENQATENAAGQVAGNTGQISNYSTESEKSQEGVDGEKVIQPVHEVEPEESTGNKYGDMLTAALNEPVPGLPADAKLGASGNIVKEVPAVTEEGASGGSVTAGSTSNATVTNPAAGATPVVPEAPEINGVPEMNYAPMPGDEILPKPPTPPVDFGGSVPEVNNAMGASGTQTTNGGAAEVNPPAQASASQTPAGAENPVFSSNPNDNPGEFKIPGM